MSSLRDLGLVWDVDQNLEKFGNGSLARGILEDKTCQTDHYDDELTGGKIGSECDILHSWRLHLYLWLVTTLMFVCVEEGRVEVKFLMY